AVDLGVPVRPLIEARFLRRPVELGSPRLAQIAQLRKVGAVVPARAGDLVGPARPSEPLPKVVEHRRRDLDPKVPNFCAGHRLAPVALVIGRQSGRSARAGTSAGARPYTPHP